MATGKPGRKAQGTFVAHHSPKVQRFANRFDNCFRTPRVRGPLAAITRAHEHHGLPDYVQLSVRQVEQIRELYALAIENLESVTS